MVLYRILLVDISLVNQAHFVPVRASVMDFTSLHGSPCYLLCGRDASVEGMRLHLLFKSIRKRFYFRCDIHSFQIVSRSQWRWRTVPDER